MGFFGGSSVDLTSPGPIGSTTPNTGRFTTLTLAPSANTTPFTASGYSLTGTNAQSILDLSGTWNTTGTPTAIKLNVTDTASNASSLLMDLQVGGSSKFSATKAGSLILPSGQSVRSNGANYANIVLTDGFGNGTGFLFGGYNTPTVGKLNFYMLGSGEWTLQLNLGSSISWNDNSNVVGGTRDLILTRDSSNTLAQRNSTNAQTFRLYNTYTDASNYERGFFRWNTNVLEIGAEAAGTGTQRGVDIKVGATSVLSISGTTATFVSRVSASNYAIGASFIYADPISNGFRFVDSSGNTLASGGFFLYNSYTNTTNNERGFVRWGSNRFQVGTISIGTGTSRTCEITFYTSASDPTSSDITSGYFSVWKNSGTGTIKLWANDGGTMKSVALA